MQREIINGMTVIHTGSTGEEIINKTGHIGATIYEKQNRKYRSEIAIGRKKILHRIF